MQKNTGQSPKLRGFISYAHSDEDYFKLIKEGLRKHGKLSTLIDSDLWTDQKILAGSLWHVSIQEQVKDCDFAIFLVSSNFLASEYIAEHEFKNFLKRQEENGFLFFPLLINACNFTYWEDLAARQFFMPNARDYGHPEIEDKLTFGDLVQHNLRTGEVLPNPYRERYLMDAIKKIEEALAEYQKRKAVKNTIPAAPYFYIRHISEIQPKDFLETRSLPRQGFRSYYLKRRYIDEKLSDNYKNRKHTIITGKPLAGKTRAVFELVNASKEKDILVFYPELSNFKIDEFRIPETEAEIIVFFDDFERFLHLENLDLALKKLMLCENLWVVATCRRERLPEVRITLDDEFHNFDIIEVLLLERMKNEGLRPDEEIFSWLIHKAPDFEQAERVLVRMENEGLRPDELTFNFLLNKAPDFERALQVLDLIRQYGVKFEKSMNSTLLKIAQLKRKGHLNKEAERAFFERHFKSISNLDDRFVRLFSEAMYVPQHKAKLIECLKVKNWWYWRTKADIVIESDHQTCFEYLEKATADVPPIHLTHVHTIWVKNVVFNNLLGVYEDALQRCEECLLIQPKGKLSYIGKLLLWLHLRQHNDVDAGITAIKASVEQWQFPVKKVNAFLRGGILKELPTAPIQHWYLVLPEIQLENHI